MKVLALTWEFPPVITGGLGMACYGMTQALLRHDVQVDLIMPAKESVYFSFKNPNDVDSMQPVFADPLKQGKFPSHMTVQELKKLIGSPLSVYATAPHTACTIPAFENMPSSDLYDYLFEALSGDYYLFQQVRHYTETAVEIGTSIQDYDVIHAHDWLTYPAAMILKKLTNRPFVAHVHATEFDRAAGAGDRQIHNIEYMALKNADRVITVSAYTARIIAEKYHVSPEKTTVVHNAYTAGDTTDRRRP